MVYNIKNGDIRDLSKNYVENRSEILFFFEVNYNNPNGDPNFDNRPRVDESDGICLISPYRTKRTIRDYLREYESEKVLINNYDNIAEKYFKLNSIQLPDEIQTIESAEDLSKIMFKNFIDVRLFGIALPIKLKSKSIEHYGPVQFSYAKSMHSIDIQKNQGTAAFASQSNKRNRSFRKEYIIPYGLFSLYGVINENAGRFTQLKYKDCLKLERALWNGTNVLQSRTKIGHKSRLLMRIEYSKKNFQMNLARNLIKIKKIKKYERLRNINQIEFDLEVFLKELEKYRANIQKIRICEELISIWGHKDIFSAIEDINIEYEIIQV